MRFTCFVTRVEIYASSSLDLFLFDRWKSKICEKEVNWGWCGGAEPHIYDVHTYYKHCCYETQLLQIASTPTQRSNVHLQRLFSHTPWTWAWNLLQNPPRCNSDIYKIIRTVHPPVINMAQKLSLCSLTAQEDNVLPVLQYFMVDLSFYFTS